MWHEFLSNVGVTDAVPICASNECWQLFQMKRLCTAGVGYSRSEINHEVGTIAVVTNDRQMAQVDARRVICVCRSGEKCFRKPINRYMVALDFCWEAMSQNNYGCWYAF